MFEKTKAFSGFAVNDLMKAKQFYGETLGVGVKELDAENGLLELQLDGGDRPTLVYIKDDLEPANYTILNFQVDDVAKTVDELTERGVEFERYPGTETETDERGVFRGGGPLIAWFKDPAGNILSVIEAD